MSSSDHIMGLLRTILPHSRNKSIWMLHSKAWVFKRYVYALSIPLNFMNYNIVQLEMVNVVVALKIWGHLWANKRVEICCDNRAVVDVLSFGRAKDSVLATCARNVWLLAAMYNIDIVVSHVPGITNTAADLLSRWRGTTQDFHRLQQLVDFPVWVDTHIDLTL